MSAQKSNSNTVWYIYIYIFVDSNYSNIPDKLKILDHKYCKKRIIDHFVIILHSYLALNIVHVCFKGYHDCDHIVVCRPVYYYVFAVFTMLFYSKLRPTFEPDYSTLEQTSFFQNLFVQKGTYRD